jgi:hypothetical protein
MMKRHVLIALPLFLGCSVGFSAASVSPAAPAGISFRQVLDIVEKAGYKNLHEIERNHHGYKVEAFDAKGKKVEFHVDAKTGAMSPVKPCEKKHPHHKKHKAN